MKEHWHGNESHVLKLCYCTLRLAGLGTQFMCCVHSSLPESLDQRCLIACVASMPCFASSHVQYSTLALGVPLKQGMRITPSAAH